MFYIIAANRTFFPQKEKEKKKEEKKRDREPEKPLKGLGVEKVRSVSCITYTNSSLSLFYKVCCCMRKD